jgi:hypothetical protein
MALSAPCPSCKTVEFPGAQGLRACSIETTKRNALFRRALAWRPAPAGNLRDILGNRSETCVAQHL